MKQRNKTLVKGLLRKRWVYICQEISLHTNWFSHANQNINREYQLMLFSSWCNYSAIQLQVVLNQTLWLFMYSLG